SLAPLGIIVGAITAMGVGVWATDRVIFGRPRPVQRDDWDYMLETRDKQMFKDIGIDKSPYAR
ncbi:unnamed protein product, partial [marine sediment metagenome]